LPPATITLRVAEEESQPASRSAAAAFAEAALGGAFGDADAFAAWRAAARWPTLFHHRNDARQPA